MWDGQPLLVLRSVNCHMQKRSVAHFGLATMYSQLIFVFFPSHPTSMISSINCTRIKTHAISARFASGQVSR